MSQPKTYNEVCGLLGEVTGKDNRVGCPKIMLDFMGDADGGNFLNQMFFYFSWAFFKAGRNDGRFWKSADEWFEDLRIRRRKLQAVTRKLEKLGVLVTEVKRANGAPTTHYYFNQPRMIELLIEFAAENDYGSYRSLEEFEWRGDGADGPNCTNVQNGNVQMSKTDGSKSNSEMDKRTKRNVQMSKTRTDHTTDHTSKKTTKENTTNTRARAREGGNSEMEPAASDGFSFSSSDWDRVKGLIKDRLTRGMFEGLVKESQFEAVNDDTLIIRVGSKHHAERINGLLQKPVQQSLTYYLNHIVDTPNGQMSFRAVA